MKHKLSLFLFLFTLPLIVQLSCGGSDGSADADGDGALECGSGEQDCDCDDSDSDVYPGAAERCDNEDNDCNGLVDDGLIEGYYLDLDGDGQGDADGALESCYELTWATSNASDCNDSNSTIGEDFEELCDGLDNDCDQEIDEGLELEDFYPDLDGDGVGSETGSPSLACAAPEGYVPSSGDCDDDNTSIYPEAEELCDGVNNDCDEQIDEGFDSDSDGYVSCTDDCDDTNDAIHLDAEEVCDSVDNNCDGQIDEGFDSDSDGFTTCGGDCDDTNAEINPEAPELCDGFDNNCDEQIDEVDWDEDGYPCSDDCSDKDSTINPGVVETGDLECDQTDNNCDGWTDEGRDSDQDGYTTCFEGEDNFDCNDRDTSTYPGAEELPDGKDNDCDGLIDEND